LRQHAHLRRGVFAVRQGLAEFGGVVLGHSKFPLFPESFALTARYAAARLAGRREPCNRWLLGDDLNPEAGRLM
jgi:hypothetical protein